MKRFFQTLPGLVIMALIITSHIRLEAQYAYTDYNNMVKRIRDYQSVYPELCSVRSLARTEGDREIWVVSIGSGDRDGKPGIAIIGGVEGNYTLGREIALGFISSLLKESSTQEVKGLLSKITFYVLPDVSPDASEQFFSDLKYERTGNERSTDDDHDFVFDEDGYEDLNKDGLITLIRIKDPAGTWVPCEEDNRVMAEADISKGETGEYLLYSEGTDNDKDGSFNEDGPGGVDFNRNFTFNYEFSGPGSGMNPVSEPETRAVADFLFDRFNIYTVFTFGPDDNLGQPMKAEPVNDKDRIIKSILKEDETVNKFVSDKYHEITGRTGAPDRKPGNGNFMEWAYFHYGRYSFSTPGWWFNVPKGKNREAAFLKFAENGRMENVFIPWARIEDPDFPGKTAEVGGIRPFAMINPPADSLESIIAGNYSFLKAVAFMHPELEFLDLKTEKTGENIYRISLKVHNAGLFATVARIGEDLIWTRIMRISVNPSKGQTILSGLKVQKIARLEGNQSGEFSWLISGKGRVNITAGALNTGTINTEIELR